MSYAGARPSPQLDYVTYADVAAMLGCSVDVLKRRMKQYDDEGFPKPAPWWRREKRWRADAVRRWIEERERRAGALGKPTLALVADNQQGGRS